MNCKTKMASNEQIMLRDTACDPQSMDRSVAYEMINDFGVDAFLGVVRQYQVNMARNLRMLDKRIDQQDTVEQIWALQYIRNCSAQLGLSAVSLHCKMVMDELIEDAEPDMKLSPDGYRQFEVIIDSSVEMLTALCVKMH